MISIPESLSVDDGRQSGQPVSALGQIDYLGVGGTPALVGSDGRVKEEAAIGLEEDGDAIGSDLLVLDQQIVHHFVDDGEHLNEGVVLHGVI